jgi:hypothetical protein
LAKLLLREYSEILQKSSSVLCVEGRKLHGDITQKPMSAGQGGVISSEESSREIADSKPTEAKGARGIWACP